MEDITNFNDRAPGADDNASGVCSLLEIARILYNIRLQVSIQFVFFSGEEQGQWGSKSYVSYVRDNNINLYRLINIDMVGQPGLGNNCIIVERDHGNSISNNDKDSQCFGEKLEQAAVDYTDFQVFWVRFMIVIICHLKLGLCGRRGLRWRTGSWYLPYQEGSA